MQKKQWKEADDQTVHMIDMCSRKGMQVPSVISVQHYCSGSHQHTIHVSGGVSSSSVTYLDVCEFNGYVHP